MSVTAGPAGAEKGTDSVDKADEVIAWLSTRKFLKVADVLPDDRLLSRHLLHDVLHLKSSFQTLDYVQNLLKINSAKHMVHSFINCNFKF